MNQSGANFAKFENSQKIEDKSYDDNFFTVVIRSTRSFWGAKKNIWGYVHFKIIFGFKFFKPA